MNHPYNDQIEHDLKLEARCLAERFPAGAAPVDRIRRRRWEVATNRIVMVGALLLGGGSLLVLRARSFIPADASTAVTAVKPADRPTLAADSGVAEYLALPDSIRVGWELIVNAPDGAGGTKPVVAGYLVIPQRNPVSLDQLSVGQRYAVEQVVRDELTSGPEI